MQFTKENWENAPEGAGLEYNGSSHNNWVPAYLVGFKRDGAVVIEIGTNHTFTVCTNIEFLRIILPKRKVTVQLWRNKDGGIATCHAGSVWTSSLDWTFLDEHTFEIEEE